MTAVTAEHATTPLAPVTATLRAMFGTDQLPGLAPGLLVDDETGWLPATDLVSGLRLAELLDAAAVRWNAQPAAAAALAWKAYCYWLTLPAVLGWAAARRVPMLEPADVLVRIDDGPLVTIGLRRSISIAVLRSDPLALGAVPGVRVVRDDAELLAALRASLREAHLDPLLGAFHDRVRVGARTLLGSVASGVAQAVLRASDTLPGPATGTVGGVLSALGVADLIELVPGRAGQPTVQRKTCCLAFTLPKPKLCADCCIRPS